MNNAEIRKHKAEIARRLYEKNPEKYKKRSSKYYSKHKMKILQKQKNRDRIPVNAYHRQYKRIHPFRSICTLTNRYYDEKIVPQDLWNLAKLQRLICALTGDKLTRDNLSVDHILSRACGGRNIVSNLRLVTKEANFLKNVHSDEHLLALCRKVIDHMEKS